MLTDDQPGGTLIRIAICDDSERSRAELQNVLESETDLSVVTVGAVDQTLAIAERSPAQVMLLAGDPRNQGIVSALSDVCRHFPGMPVVVLSEHISPRSASVALQTGARGFLWKNASSEQMVQAVRTAAVGAVALCRRTARSLGSRSDGPVMDVVPPVDLATLRLTAQEQEVLRLLAHGMSNRGIASQMTLSPHTIKEYVSVIYAKLGTNNRVSAAVRAAQAGVMDAGELSAPPPPSPEPGFPEPAARPQPRSMDARASHRPGRTPSAV